MNRSISKLAAGATALAFVFALTACASEAGTAARQAQPAATPAPVTVTVATTDPAPPRVTVTTTRTVPRATTTTTKTAPRVTSTTPTTPPPVTTTITTTSGSPDTSSPLPVSGIRAKMGQAFDVVNHYWADLFDSWSGPSGEPIYWEAPRRYNGDGFYDSNAGPVPPCGTDNDSAGNAFFCGNVASGTGFVAWDLQFVQPASAIGDPVYYVIAGHEVGHAAQIRFQHDGQGGAVPQSDEGLELQADCLAGAALNKAQASGYLNIGADGLDEISRFQESIGDYAGSHGTPVQRVAAFYLGYHGDIESCLFNRGQPPPGWIGPR